MRSFRRFAIIFSSVVALLALPPFIMVSRSYRPPKEEKIVTDFRAHRASYERVRMMLAEDRDVTDVATWGLERGNSLDWKIPPNGGMPVARYQEYLALLKEIGAGRAGQGGDPPEVWFGVWVSGFAGDTRHVNVCWLERGPPNTVISLDAFYRTEKPRSPSYVHIEGNWYIWADW